MKKILLLSFFLIPFIGCKKISEPESFIQKGNFKVEFLFEQNGCKMYRFDDGGRKVYWSDCQGKTQSDYETGGKSRHYYKEETITTE